MKTLLLAVSLLSLSHQALATDYLACHFEVTGVDQAGNLKAVGYYENSLPVENESALLRVGEAGMLVEAEYLSADTFLFKLTPDPKYAPGFSWVMTPRLFRGHSFTFFQKLSGIVSDTHLLHVMGSCSLFDYDPYSKK